MTIISREIECVSFKLVFGVLSLLLLLWECLVLVLLLLVYIALVVTSCCTAMFFPVTHAYPTKLMTARHAGHVVTPLILFNSFVATWAFLRIGCYPLDIFTLSACLFHPHLIGAARAWQVWQPLALEAENSTAISAWDLFDESVISLLEQIFTASFWAPLHVFIVVCILFA